MSCIKQFPIVVKDFSSQYGNQDSISYTARNILGHNDDLPAYYGDHVDAFSMRTYGRWWDIAPSGRKNIRGHANNRLPSQDFIDIIFHFHVCPKNVTLFEVYNPGALVRIWAQDSNSKKWHLLYEADHLEVALPESRMFTPPLRDCSVLTNFLRLEFNHEWLDLYYQIDGILLEGVPVEPEEMFNSRTPLTEITAQGVLTRRVLTLDLKALLSRDAAPSLPSSSSVTTSSELENLSPFDSLPYELLHKIFSFLDLQSLSRCCCVCKKFKIIAEDPSLYVELNLKSDWALVEESTLLSLSSRCSNLRALDMSWTTGNLELPLLGFLSQSGSLLKILRLNSCHFVTSRLLSGISQNCTQLEELSLRKILHPGEYLHGWYALAALKNLKYLDLYHVCVFTSELLKVLPSLEQLEHLNLGASAHPSPFLNLDAVAESLAKFNLQLKSIDMWRSLGSLTSRGIKSLARCSNLQEVDLGWSEIDVLDDCIQELAKGCPHLKKFFVPAMRGLTNQDVLTLINKCTQLEQVDLLGIRNISPEVCYRMLSQCRHLKLLDVGYCEKISPAHVALWRVQFPHVSIKQCIS